MKTILSILFVCVIGFSLLGLQQAFALGIFPGPKGPAGPQGPAGAAGKNGTNGTNGTNGIVSSGQNIGKGGKGIYAGLSAGKLQTKNITSANSGLTITSNGTDVILTNNALTSAITSLNFTTNNDFDFNFHGNGSSLVLIGQVFQFALKSDVVLTNGSTQTFTKQINFNGIVNHWLQTNFNNAVLVLRNSASTFATTIAGGSQLSNQTITTPVIVQSETFALKPLLNFTNPANQTGTLSTDSVMYGGYATFTPKVTGRVEVTVSGYASNSLGGDGCRIDVRYGTSNLGVNGAAKTGTIAGSNEKIGIPLAGGNIPFSKTVQITGLVISTKEYIDLTVATITAGTCTVNNVDWSIKEL